jgi:ABC-type glycerol-3-phosphate transport system substrate-binding protein
MGTANGWAIPTYAPHKQEAADFIAFLVSPERATAYFNQTGAWPGTRRINLDQVVDPVGFGDVRVKWHTQAAGFTYWWDMMYPTKPADALGLATVGLSTGEMTTLEEAAKVLDQYLADWRNGAPEEVKSFLKWHKEMADLMPDFKP